MSFLRRANELEERAKSHGTEHDKHNLLASAQRIRALKDKCDFEDWLEEDRRRFAKYDQSGNGFLEFLEFQELVCAAFEMKREQANTAWKLWDIDTGGSIGPYEYVTMMSVYHTERAFHDAMIESERVLTANEAVPCSCCAPYAFVFGLFCSACTLGLSWIPMCCIAQGTEKRLEQAYEDQAETRRRNFMVAAGPARAIDSTGRHTRRPRSLREKSCCRARRLECSSLKSAPKCRAKSPNSNWKTALGSEIAPSRTLALNEVNEQAP